MKRFVVVNGAGRVTEPQGFASCMADAVRWSNTHGRECEIVQTRRNGELADVDRAAYTVPAPQVGMWMIREVY